MRKRRVRPQGRLRVPCRRVSTSRVLVTATIAAAAVVLSSVGGIAATHKQVKVNVAGKTVEVSTWARDTHSVLAEAGIELGHHDVVIPSRSTSVANGSAITVNRARPVSVIKHDGEVSRHWSAATSVVEVAKEVSNADKTKMQVAAVRTDSESLPVADEKTNVEVIHDGTTTSVEVAAGADSSKVLQSANIEVSPLDKVRLGVNDSGSPVVTVVRVSRGLNVVSKSVEHEVVEEEDDTLLEGKKETVTEGEKGFIEARSFTVVEDGEVIHQSPAEEVVISEPVTAVVKIGTKKEVETVAAPANPSENQQIALGLLPSYGFTDDQFGCLVNLWNRESGWNPNSHNRHSGAHGIPQALPGSKMASAGPNWQTNPETQIKWGLGYIKGRYGTPCGAWNFFQSKNWY